MQIYVCALFHLKIFLLNVSFVFTATAVVMSIMSGPPFNAATDQNIAIAYVSAFIFIFFVSFRFL